MKYQIMKGVLSKPKKVVIYGVEGIGKTTIASKFPDPIFIDTEESSFFLNVARLPKPTSYAMLLEEVNDIIAEKPCKTLVIDTADWAERLVIESVCQKNNKKGIEDFGYGNGYTYVAEEWGRFLNKLSEVTDAGINVVLTAHAMIRKFEQPDELGAYDRYELKLGAKTTGKTAGLTKEWADMVLFANYETFAVAGSDAPNAKKKAQGGRRVMYTSHHPCWDAKNRYGLPDKVEFDYKSIKHIIEDRVEKPTEPVEEIKQAPVPQVYTEPVVDYTGIPNELAGLMKSNRIKPIDLQAMAARKGHFPMTTPITAYPPEYFGFVLSNWADVLKDIEKNLLREV